ncbi:MAG: sugar ABC transporter permease [Clostridia bacterium]|nr:sugar ABC transporter permease [Oscillospiraceae bacterium]MDY3303707.1 sugar ABC transporter permease [Clostridia bacterium]MDY5626063.1 sugar ABC transporter permease [Clostridia bacterium]
MEYRTKQLTRKNGIRSRKIKMSVQCYLLLSVQIIGLVLLSFYPIVWSLKWAFYYYTGVPSETHFVGWQNFIKLFTDDTSYFHSWIITLKFTFIKLPIELALALFIAILVNNRLIKGKTFFRSVYFFPTIIATSIIAVVFSNLFDYYGFINFLLKKVGLISSAIDWISNKNLAMIFLVITSIWANIGTNILYFVAALQNIPNDLYEVARIEGASPVAVFFKITLPMILPVFQIVLLLGINGTLQTGEFVVLLTNGAPGGETLTVLAHIINSYLPGFTNGVINIGYGAALSFVTSIIMCLIGVGYMKLSNKIKNMY